MSDCLFCKIINKEIPSNIVYEDNLCLAFLDINPANNGHTLIVPKVHCQNFSDLSDDVACQLALVSKKVLNSILNSEIISQGANILMNQGSSAGQEVFHFHWHLIPRYDKDFLGYAFDRAPQNKTYEPLAIIADKIKSNIN